MLHRLPRGKKLIFQAVVRAKGIEIHLEELVKTHTYQASLEPWQAALGTPDWNSGRIEAWRDLAGALRCALYLPGGICWDDVVPRI
jgi:hypothetical protein